MRVLDEQGVPVLTLCSSAAAMRRALLMSQLGTVLSLLALGGLAVVWPGIGCRPMHLQTASGGIAWFLLLVLLTTLVAGVLPRAWVLSSPERAALTLAPVLKQ